ncbi:hypothetical protein [Caballeronia sp. EK]|nr:hypothetical protein [Caballeronia sp. EK]
MNADAQAIVFVLILPVLCGIAAGLYTQACEAADARASGGSK